MTAGIVFSQSCRYSLFPFEVNELKTAALAGNITRGLYYFRAIGFFRE